jgi:uncharacterized membrane protein YdjX (TVP38/TMEM64 family)
MRADEYAHTWLAFVAAIAAVVLATFLVVEAVGVGVLEDPEPLLDGAGVSPAALGVGLLVADAVVPVPSSLVMISLGTLYGPFVGALLALLGRFGMAVVGLFAGRAGAPVLMKLVTRGQREYGEALVARHGALAIILSRPVPILAETVVLTAGAARLRWRVALPAAFIGSLPEAVAYGLVGAAAANGAYGAFVWLGFVVVAIALRLAVRRRRLRALASAGAPRSFSRSAYERTARPGQA